MPTGFPGRQSLRHHGAMRVFTIGHSTRSSEELIELLQESGVELLVDVRRFPRSRTNPQFNAETLGPALAARAIGYRHLAALGGRRDGGKSATPSANTFWRQTAFRAYADYAATPAFRSAFEELLALARDRALAIMCAEAVWWRCHRRIVADYLLARGIEVRHILGPGKVEPARLTPGAILGEGGTLVYRREGEPARLPGL